MGEAKINNTVLAGGQPRNKENKKRGELKRGGAHPFTNTRWIMGYLLGDSPSVRVPTGTLHPSHSPLTSGLCLLHVLSPPLRPAHALAPFFAHRRPLALPFLSTAFLSRRVGSPRAPLSFIAGLLTPPLIS